MAKLISYLKKRDMFPGPSASVVINLLETDGHVKNWLKMKVTCFQLHISLNHLPYFVLQKCFVAALRIGLSDYWLDIASNFQSLFEV